MIFYSPDRRQQLLNTVECLREMDYYEQCQKILCVDGELNVELADFTPLAVRREGCYFCWANAWESGMNAAQHDIVLYLDADRILPKDYLKKALLYARDGRIVYSHTLCRLRQDFNIDFLKKLRDRCDKNRSIEGLDAFMTKEHRLRQPGPEFGKNPFSGNTILTKSTYEKIKTDPRYIGCGFPDTDMFMTAVVKKLEFFTIDCIELHQMHGYTNSPAIVKRMNLWNGVQFCRKWRLPPGRSLRRRLRELGRTFQSVSPDLDKFLDSFKYSNQPV